MDLFGSWLKKEGASIILGVSGLLITVIFSISNCSLEEKKQRNEIRVKYLDLALAERRDPYEKERVLEFLANLDGDPAVQKWAQDGLNIIRETKKAKKNREALEQKADLERDSILAALKKNLAVKAREIEQQRKRTLYKLDSINREIRQLEKSVSVVSSPTQPIVPIITPPPIEIAPTCNTSTIRTNAMEEAARHSCFISQEGASKRREGNRLIWQAPYLPGMSFAAPATCYCDIQ